LSLPARFRREDKAGGKAARFIGDRAGRGIGREFVFLWRREIDQDHAAGRPTLTIYGHISAWLAQGWLQEDSRLGSSGRWFKSPAAWFPVEEEGKGHRPDYSNNDKHQYLTD
jgi:hypothetical protein